MARDQALDPEFRRISADARTGLQLRAVDLGNRKLICDVSNGPARPFVPFSWRRRVFEVMHGLGHPGVERTRQTISEKFVWPSMRQDVSKWARECLHCQRAKVLKHVVPPIGDFVVPDKRFEHLNLDLVTLPPSNGFKYLLTIVDRFSRWPVAIPIKDIAVDTILDAFAHGWVSTFGIPSSITTDRGAQFLSAAWSQLMTTWGIRSLTTTAYHPEANGLVERLHRRLKEALLASSHDHPEQWYWKLPSVLLSIRTTLKPDIGASPAELLFGEPIAVPGSLLSNNPSDDPQLLQQQRHTLANLRLEVARLQPTQTSAHRRPNVRLPEDLQTCTHVFIRKGGVQPCLSTPYTGPYRVISRQPHSFKVSIPGRGTESVALARLKPAVIANDPELQQGPVTPPPRRGPGRPPKRRQEPPPPPSPPPPPLRPGLRPRRQRTANANGITAISQSPFPLPPSPILQASSPPLPPSPRMHALPLPPPSPPPSTSREAVTDNEPNCDAHLQRRQEQEPVSHEPALFSPPRLTEQCQEENSFSCGTCPRAAGETRSVPAPAQVQPHAAAAGPAPLSLTRSGQGRFSAMQTKGKRSHVNYAASLAAVMERYL